MERPGNGGLSRGCGTDEFRARLGKRLSLVTLVAVASVSALHAEAPLAPLNADWKADAPGVRHQYRVDDLPAPFASESASNSPREVRPPAGGAPQAPTALQ